MDHQEKSSKEDPPTKPSIPPRTQKPQSRSSLDMDDNESKNLKAEHRNLKKEYDETRQELRSAWREKQGPVSRTPRSQEA